MWILSFRRFWCPWCRNQLRTRQRTAQRLAANSCASSPPPAFPARSAWSQPSAPYRLPTCSKQRSSNSTARANSRSPAAGTCARSAISITTISSIRTRQLRIIIRCRLRKRTCENRPPLLAAAGQRIDAGISRLMFLCVVCGISAPAAILKRRVLLLSEFLNTEIHVR
jgi:hypothetical protein